MNVVSLYDEKCCLLSNRRKNGLIDWIGYEKSAGFFYRNMKEEGVYKEFFAVRQLICMFPLNFSFRNLAIPPLYAHTWIPLYKWIAKNCYKFFRKKRDDGNCSLKFSQSKSMKIIDIV